MRLDSHLHFWRYDPFEHTWITERMGALKRDYLPEHLQSLLKSIDFAGCIAVQARQTLAETRWLLRLAELHSFIKGVVGWVDLRSTNLATQLKTFSKHPRLVGVRHVVHDELDDKYMLAIEFRRGIAQLRAFGLAYDLLLFPKHLPVAVQLVTEFPGQPFVLDHIAKPAIAQGLTTPWRENLRELASFPNVCCKLSGFVTEVEWGQWQPYVFHQYLDIVFAAFGPDRVMIGSDWPVCTLSGEYEATMQIVVDYVQQFPTEVRDGILGENCARFYGIPA